MGTKTFTKLDPANLDDVQGGVTEGGCVPPWPRPQPSPLPLPSPSPFPRPGPCPLPSPFPPFQ